jgi:hypothetical protein
MGANVSCKRSLPSPHSCAVRQLVDLRQIHRSGREPRSKKEVTREPPSELTASLAIPRVLLEQNQDISHRNALNRKLLTCYEQVPLILAPRY